MLTSCVRYRYSAYHEWACIFLAENPETQPGISNSTQYFAGSIRGSIINDNRLKVVKLLQSDRMKRFLKISLRIVGRNNYGEQRVCSSIFHFIHTLRPNPS